MPGIHRHGDSRGCGATTIVTGQVHVYVEGRLVAVEGDQCSHGGGGLEAVYGARNVYVNGRLVIVAVGDDADKPDGFGHLDDQPVGSSDVAFAY